MFTGNQCTRSSAGITLYINGVFMFQIYLNFTAYNLAKPNECEENYIQIFGRELEEEKK